MLKIVRRMIDQYPFAGVCCNLQMISHLKRRDFANIVRELREATGGIRAMQQLSDSVDICATQVMSTLQGICALQAGVKYIAVFYCFMQMGGADEHGLYSGVDAKLVYSALTQFLEMSGCDARIMACAPQNSGRVKFLY